MKLASPAVLALVVVAFLTACAPKMDSASAPAQAPGAEELQKKLAKFLPDLKAEDIRATEAAGLYEVKSDGNYGYVTADGKFLIAGDLVDLGSGESLTENRRRGDRVAKLEALGTDNMIVFAPAGGTKHVVTVFTDIDCGYCRKLHSEIAQYNAAGIEIRYVSYPRSGPNSESFHKAQAVWCAADRKAALTAAKQGGAVTGEAACNDPIGREWALGNELGLRGTPLLVLEDGSVVNGYVPAAALAQRLATPSRAALTGSPKQG